MAFGIPPQNSAVAGSAGTPLAGTSLPVGNGQQSWNARVQRDEILDGRTRIVGYRFRVLPIDETVAPPGPEMKLNALKADGFDAFTHHQRLAIVPISVNDWRMLDYRQFATRNTVFHLGVSPNDGASPDWLRTIEAIRASGARVALDWALIESELGELLEFADVIFVRPSEYSASALGHVVDGLRERYQGTSIAADGVASWSEYRDCLTMGIHYCLGGFTATPYQADEIQRQLVIDNVLDNKLVQFYWYRVFECGCEEIDRDHQALFALATDLLNAIMAGRSNGKIADMVEELLARAGEHFAQEEALLAAAGYARLDEHAAIHRMLADKAARLVADFKSGKVEIGAVFQFLAQDLIVHHMLGADREFFPLFVQSQDAKGKPVATAVNDKGASCPLPPPKGAAVGAQLM